MPRKLRMRWHGDDQPRLGDYLLSAGPRARAAYQILGIADRGSRGGLGEPVYRLLILTVERVPREEALRCREGYMEFEWDRRPKRRAQSLADIQEREDAR